jgi:serine protease Do
MSRRVFLLPVLFCIFRSFCFGQTESLRDYVGLINQTFHPDIVAYLGKFRADFERRGNKEAAQGIENYLQGVSGTGFVFTAGDGQSYIITNHHVITQSHNISISFEKRDGAKVVYDGLKIIAADEDMDIALLAFPAGEGGTSFGQGLSFLDRPVEEGEDVYSAGFPGLGSVNLWQFGRGMVSNAHVEFPEDGRIMGPYIQHTAQVDPGNSGGPLLVQAEGVPTGYAVAGINTLSARFRQAANFSIPIDRARAFLGSALGPKPADERSRLEARLDTFIKGLAEPRAVYEHIAKYLSNACVGENAEYALVETLRNATSTVQDDIIRAFVDSPVEGMGYAVAWTIENALRTRPGRINLTVESINPNSGGGFTVVFNAGGGSLSSEWINDYGNWRISAFGDFASGDKALVEQRDQRARDERRLRTGYTLQLSAGLAYILERGPAFGADFKYRSDFTGYGLKIYTTGKDFFQAESTGGIYVPIRLQKIGLTPYGDLGFGFVSQEPAAGTTSGFGSFGLSARDVGVAITVKGGLMLTTSLVPGLYFQAAYQHNFYLGEALKKNNPSMLFFSIGYGFQ